MNDDIQSDARGAGGVSLPCGFERSAERLWNHGMRYLTVLVATAFVPVVLQAADRAIPVGLPDGADVHLGQTIHRVVFELGPPDHIRLSGETDGAYDPTPTDSLVLSWNNRDCEFGTEMCTYWATFPSGSAKLSRIAIYLESTGRPTLQSFRTTLDGEDRVVRYELIPDEGDIEATIADCVSPDGGAVALVLPEVGLDAFLEHNSERIELLSYSIDRKIQGWPKGCDH